MLSTGSDGLDCRVEEEEVDVVVVVAVPAAVASDRRTPSSPTLIIVETEELSRLLSQRCTTAGGVSPCVLRIESM